MLRRNFMSMLGLSGIGSLFGFSNSSKEKTNFINLSLGQHIRIEENKELEPEEYYEEDQIFRQRLIKYKTLIQLPDGQRKLVYHNPQGPARIDYLSNGDCYWDWFENGKQPFRTGKITRIVFWKDPNEFYVYYDSNPQWKYMRFVLDSGEFQDEVFGEPVVKSREYFESQIGMTIDQLMSLS